MGLTQEAQVASDLVRQAGRLALAMRREGIQTNEKTSVSDIVTEADRAAERLVVDGLRAAFPDDSVVGEEGTDHTGTSPRTWVIDPVDGTWNYAQGIPWWCSALALSDERDVLFGAVHDPHADAVFLGGPDLPSTRDGEPLPPMVDRSLEQSGVATYLHPPFHHGEIGAAFARAVRGAATIRMLGSGTMDQLAVAQGKLGALVQHSVPAWDWLPGTAIVRGVGGVARQVSAAGVVWSVSGAPTAVEQICEALD